MPTLEVQTNVDASKLTPELAGKAAQVVADALGKPKSYVIVSFKSAVMSMGGESGPTAIAHLGSIGKIDREMNKKTSKALSAFLVKELGLPEDKFYIMFHNLNKENVGWKGTTFDDFL
ncbi:macrophage migration inhibitory factor [Tetranychus urticae]|uniref:L-dopachrome isomerase n=1 Tax=Tetranychus urticae TaxID=32264 RepID=T1KBJ0_TETUR|nr:macrophage migration inhibitory factor [Tetranychus urticae]